MKEILKMTARILYMLSPALIGSIVGLAVYMLLEEIVDETL
jgi:hypothetical protein